MWENIRGGRAYYTVVWDVFRDVAEVDNAEFFVKVDLVSDMAVPATSDSLNNSTSTGDGERIGSHISGFRRNCTTEGRN